MVLPTVSFGVVVKLCSSRHKVSSVSEEDVDFHPLTIIVE